MLDILNYIHKRKRKTSSGWVAFDGICCHHRGHKPDTRSRAGVIYSDADNWTYHCFNCQFKCSFVLGNIFSEKLKLLLSWCGLNEEEINRLSLKNFSHRSVLDLYTTKSNLLTDVSFSEKSLPENARLLTDSDVEFNDYLKRRGLYESEYLFYTVDNEIRKRVIIPFFYKNQLVGYTSRYLDNRKPKYISEQQRGYVFNLDKQHDDWQSCILVEGPFDAMSIDGCAFMSNTISDIQIRLLKSLHRRIILVPDRDKSGLSVCDLALESGFYVSIPNWSEDIKDTNDAVVKYGKIPTLISILESATTSKIIVEMKRKKINVK